MDKKYRRAFKGRSIGDLGQFRYVHSDFICYQSITRFMRSIYSAGEGPLETDIVETMLSKLNPTL